MPTGDGIRSVGRSITFEADVAGRVGMEDDHGQWQGLAQNQERGARDLS